MKKAYTIIIGFLLMSQCTVWAQQGVSASGGEATGIAGTVSYTVGQTDYITAYATDGSVSQGVQQPYVIGIVTGFLETDINLSCAISPNPTTDFVMLFHLITFAAPGQCLTVKQSCSNWCHTFLEKICR